MNWRSGAANAPIDQTKRDAIAGQLIEDCERANLDRATWSCGDTMIIVMAGDVAGAYEVYDCVIRRVADVVPEERAA